MKRNLFLNNMPVAEAQDLYFAAIDDLLQPETETIAVTDSLHRVTGAAVYARCSSPLFNAAAMDGIAVIAARTEAAGDQTPVTLKPVEDFLVVDTGDPVRAPYDAVIMAEDLIEEADGSVRIHAPAVPWQYVRSIGEDIVSGEMLLPGGHRIRPFDISVLLSGGILQIDVLRQPTVAILPTGSEIIEPTEDIQEGSIIESNSRMFQGMITEQGGLPDRYAILPDDYALIQSTVEEACRTHDLVIINAGSSAGTEDYTVHVLKELGEVIVHGVAVKPGKPVILARVNDTPVIGLPGYPVASYINFQNFVTPLLQRLSGNRETSGDTIRAVMTRRLMSSLKYREYVRVKAGQVDGKYIAAPLDRGSGAAMTLVKADGFCVIEQDSEGIDAGEEIDVILNHSAEDLRHTIVSIGSHDLLLDVLGDMLPHAHPGTNLSSTHVGSMGGLLALRRGEAHMAPTHLLDEETGIYNVAAIRRLFKEPIALIKGVDRIQGILVKKGNPLGIRGLEDLVRARYVNRQRGAGTRVLFDYKLRQADIDPTQIAGYDREAATHMAVAALVSSDGADAGMGIESAARAMDLDFIPIGPEEYDFAIPERFLGLPIVQHFLDVLTSAAFRAKAEELGGYLCRQTGDMQIIQP